MFNFQARRFEWKQRRLVLVSPVIAELMLVAVRLDFLVLENFFCAKSYFGTEKKSNSDRLLHFTH